MKTLREIVAQFVGQLYITAGERTYREDKEMKEKIIAAMMGESRPRVVVVENKYSGSRWVVLDKIRTNIQNGKHPCPSFVRLPYIHEAGCECVTCHHRHPLLVARGFEVGKTVTTQRVAEFFDPSAEDCRRVKIVAEYPEEGVPLGGDAIFMDEKKEDGDIVRIYSIDIPVGGAVYRYTPDRILWLFIRLEKDAWEVTVDPRPDWPHTRRTGGDENYSLGALLAGAITALGAVAESLEVAGDE